MDEDPYYLTLYFIQNFQESTDSNLIFSILVISTLIICSALISGSEVAFFSIDPKKWNKKSEQNSYGLVQKLLKQPNKLLATILIANNFINVGIIILSTYITSKLFNLESTPILKFIIQVIAVTFLLLMLGELIPKVFANQNSYKFAKLMARPLTFLNKLFHPISTVLVNSSSFIEKKFHSKGYSISVDDLSNVLDIAGESDTNTEEKRILRSIVEFGNIQVKEIMKSRVDVTAFSLDTSFEEVKKEIIKSGYSRIPVYNESFDKIKGVLYIKDLIPHLNTQDFNWNSIIRNPFFVPEGKMIDDLMKEFQQKKIHLAIVVDEYGGTSGIVTLEDIIEEIVGEINDEFDDDGIKFSKLDNFNYIFEGKTSINDILKILKLEFDYFDDIKGESDSLAGLILEMKGNIPELGNVIQFDRLSFKIESVDKRRIKRVKITINE